MSTLVVAALLIGFIVAVCLLLVSLDNQQKRKYMNNILQRFSAEGIQNNLSFSSQELLSDGIIGLDGVHRKLLFLKGKDETDFGAVVINLADVRRCSVKKHFGLAGGTDTKAKRPEQYLEKIVLHFQFDEQRPPVEVSFFNHVTHSISLASELETKARHWETVLSKIIAYPQNRRA